MNLDDFLSHQGIQYKIIRNNTIIANEIKGLPNHETNTNKKYIGFKPTVDIQYGDCLIGPTGQRIYVVDTDVAYFGGEPFQLKAYYQTESEHLNPASNQNVIYNISNVSSSVIGTGNVATISYTENLQNLKKTIEDVGSPDKEELQQIISLLELVVEDKIPAKKGLLSKFRDILAKHSWLIPQLTKIMLDWMTSD